ncbi:MAG TPA: hypothetical protein VM823_05665, partial [Gaiellales bacterium]|nr:hypothetical protein [Gaiellales bacterium]
CPATRGEDGAAADQKRGLPPLGGAGGVPGRDAGGQRDLLGGEAGRLVGGTYLVGRRMPEGTRRTIVGAFRCGASWRGIRCVDLTGSGEGFIIGDRIVILTAAGQKVSRH